MKVQCPCCSTGVSATNINLGTGWAKCDACQELFALSQVVPNYPHAEKGSVQRPYNARALVEQTNEELLIHLPAEGMRAATFATLGFATFWLGFIAFWTIGALGVFGGQPPAAPNILFACFSIPFWIVGFFMMAVVAWNIWGTKSLRIDRQGMRTHQRCLAWSQTRWVDLERVQYARHHERVVKTEGQQPRAVEVVYRAGSFVLSADSEDEERWLITVINDFVRSVATSP
jgi:hypothetical protein